MRNVHGAQMSDSLVMDNSSVKNPVKLCTSSSVMSGYSVLADTVISIYTTLKSGSSSYTLHSGIAMVHLFIVGGYTHAYNRSYYSIYDVVRETGIKWKTGKQVFKTWAE